MTPIGFFSELGYADGPSLLDVLNTCHDSQREAIANYLERGSALMVSSAWVDDVVQPARRRVARAAVYTDGDYVWPHSLGYYVRAYGVGVPAEFAAVVRERGEPGNLSESVLMGILDQVEVLRNQE